jgi:hypothetical protein
MDYIKNNSKSTIIKKVRNKHANFNKNYIDCIINNNYIIDEKKDFYKEIIYGNKDKITRIEIYKIRKYNQYPQKNQLKNVNLSYEDWNRL